MLFTGYWKLSNSLSLWNVQITTFKQYWSKDLSNRRMKYTKSLILKKGSIIEYPKEGTNGQNWGRFSNADCRNNFIWVFKSLSVFQSLSLLSVTLYMKDLFKNAIILFIFIYYLAKALFSINSPCSRKITDTLYLFKSILGYH